jgi:hypothetical protein
MSSPVSLSLSSFPKDVQFSILTHVDFKSLLLCARVCNLWKEIIGKENVHFWRSTYIQYLRGTLYLDKVSLDKLCEELSKGKYTCEMSAGANQLALVKQLESLKSRLKKPVENSEKPPEIAPNVKGFLSKCKNIIFKKTSSSRSAEKTDSAEKTEADRAEKALQAFQDKHPSNGILPSDFPDNPYFYCLRTFAQLKDLEADSSRGI